MNAFRLLADDLTGALDTTAELVPLAGAVPVFWPRVMPAAPKGSAAFDSATRECAPEEAAVETARSCRHLQGAALAFKKIDSLIRGATLHEIAACMRTGAWPCAILAPAFPFQRRITRGGQQLVQINGTWTLTGPHLVSALATLGVRAHLAHDDLIPGVNVFDADSDDALRTIAALGRRHPGAVLWIGTGGLAQALAADYPPPVPALPQPVLGLFGSDQPATLDQLAACAEHWLELDTDAHDPMIQGPMIQHPVIERMQAT
ncbi:MAG TPA: four-carbon acid sugar kinase family protein, partial [Rhodopila sp.]|nr:four-carbon acid sugar kinase family protein [Rhodopila sp.]